MRVTARGAVVRVNVSRADVEKFNRSWPCSNLPARPFWFEYWANGDLVDYGPSSLYGKYDGPALLALTGDAQAYAVSRWYLVPR